MLLALMLVPAYAADGGGKILVTYDGIDEPKYFDTLKEVSDYLKNDAPSDKTISVVLQEDLTSEKSNLAEHLYIPESKSVSLNLNNHIINYLNNQTSYKVESNPRCFIINNSGSLTIEGGDKGKDYNKIINSSQKSSQIIGSEGKQLILKNVTLESLRSTENNTQTSSLRLQNATCQLIENCDIIGGIHFNEKYNGGHSVIEKIDNCHIIEKNLSKSVISSYPSIDDPSGEIHELLNSVISNEYNGNKSNVIDHMDIGTISNCRISALPGNYPAGSGETSGVVGIHGTAVSNIKNSEITADIGIYAYAVNGEAIIGTIENTIINANKVAVIAAYNARIETIADCTFTGHGEGGVIRSDFNSGGIGEILSGTYTNDSGPVLWCDNSTIGVTGGEYVVKEGQIPVFIRTESTSPSYVPTGKLQLPFGKDLNDIKVDNTYVLDYTKEKIDKDIQQALDNGMPITDIQEEINELPIEYRSYAYDIAGKDEDFKKNVEKVTVTIDGAQEQIEKGNILTKPEDPVKAGYTFIGWYNGDEPYDFNSPVEADLILMSKYESKGTSVDPVDPSKPSDPTVSVNQNQTSGVSPGTGDMDYTIFLILMVAAAAIIIVLKKTAVGK